ncbi:hypothetical protein KIW84_030161 [Lathyrus oleraceus]|uniref:DUF4283 domain-containing protein n=1 Tax=Pisum sativum TaxID=3888 RepID=A0A9D5AVV5_PEA|nr:hypothetical protein KIW84_030161 [Pisum sativum]
MGKRGVGRPRLAVAARRKGGERTIVTQAIMESKEQQVGDHERQDTLESQEHQAGEHEGQDATRKEKEIPDMEPPMSMESEIEMPGVEVPETVQLRKPWVDVIRGNRRINRVVSMEYIPPTIVDGEVEVKIEESDVEDELEFWSNSIILFALGDSLSMNAVKKFMEKNWNSVSLPELYYNEEGYFIVRFRNQEDREHVLAQGPYFIYGKPLFLRQWSSDFEMKEDILWVMPLWVTFPQLPLHLWGEKCLAKIASSIGKPITMDECTTKKLRVSYARMLVEVDVTQKLRNSINVRDHNNKLVQQCIEYEWVPKYCHKCLKIGHDCALKKPMNHQVKKIWQPVGNLQKSEPSQGDQTQRGEVQPVIMVAEKPIEEEGTSTDWTMVAEKDRETRVKEDKAAGIRRYYENKWCFEDNYDKHYNGRIWLLWNKAEVIIRMIQVHEQFLHFEVYGIDNSFRYVATMIYAFNQVEHRKTLWSKLESLGSNMDRPWVVIGDFNNVLKEEDRIGGQPVSYAEYRDLDEMMHNVSLFENVSKGSYFTWSNKHTQGIIHSRIDRMVSNIQWLQKYPDAVVENLAPNISDHTPVKVSVSQQQIRKGSMFKFLNCSVKEPTYMQIVKNSWQEEVIGNNMYRLWRKLLRLQPILKKLNSQYSDIQDQIQKARQLLLDE